MQYVDMMLLHGSDGKLVHQSEPALAGHPPTPTANFLYTVLRTNVLVLEEGVFGCVVVKDAYFRILC